MSKLFKKEGNLIAIGFPGEKLPQLGPFSIYYSNNYWKVNVGDIMNQSKQIIVYAGSSEGCIWELEYIISNMLFNKTFIYIPGEKKEFSFFKEFFEIRTAIRLPDNKGKDTILLFDDKNFAYLLKIDPFHFSTLPDFVYIIKKAVQLKKNNFKITSLHRQINIGKLQIVDAKLPNN